MVSIRSGHGTSIASVLEELKGAECSEMDDDTSRIANKGDPTCVKQSETEETTEKPKPISSSRLSVASSCSSSGSGKRTEFKISPLCVQDPFELVHNLTQNITVSALKHIIELMKIAHKICKDLNSGGDNPNATKLLDLLTVCRSAKKRKSSHCHSFFVEYQDISPQTFDASCSAKLTTPRGIFLFIVKTLEREFGLKCEMKSLAKRPCNSGQDLGMSQAAPAVTAPQVAQAVTVSQVTQAVTVSQVSQSLGETPTGSCTDTRNDSDAKEENDQARTSLEIDKNEDNFSAICTAFENTWTHCRKERRKSLQLQKQRNESSENDGKDASFESEKSEQTYPEKSEEPTSITLPQPKEFADVHTVASPILIFELYVNSAPQKDTKHGCTVSMEQAESKDFQLFGNFFTAYKKYFMGLTTK